MNPAYFPEANIVIGPPKDMTEDDVGSVNAHAGPKTIAGKEVPVITLCFKPTQADLNLLQITGTLWLQVITNQLPPVFVTSLSPFDEKEKDIPVVCSKGHPIGCYNSKNICQWCYLIGMVRGLLVIAAEGDPEETSKAIMRLEELIK